MIRPWPTLDSQPSGDFRIFKVRTDRKRSPRTGNDHDFFVIDCADWVNVIAVTPDQQLVMIEQYRHGSNTIELEIPGGIIDPEDASPLAAGLRELREETGYAGQDPMLLGDIFPNPAIMSNTCHTVLVQACEPRYATAWDHGEDMQTRLVPISEIPGHVAAGRIKHSLVVVALFHFELWRQKNLQVNS